MDTLQILRDDFPAPQRHSVRFRLLSKCLSCHISKSQLCFLEWLAAWTVGTQWVKIQSRKSAQESHRSENDKIGEKSHEHAPEDHRRQSLDVIAQRVEIPRCVRHVLCRWTKSSVPRVREPCCFTPLRWSRDVDEFLRVIREVLWNSSFNFWSRALLCPSAMRGRRHLPFQKQQKDSTSTLPQTIR